MLNKIISILNDNHISKYLINEEIKETVELFFIKKRLDMRREKNVHHYSLTVYNEFDKDGVKMLGSSTVSIFQGMTEKEMHTVIQNAYYAASFVCNPYYELPIGTKEETLEMKSSLTSHSLSESAMIMVEALFSEDTLEDVFINSAEMFVESHMSHIINSRGIDVSYKKSLLKGEFVAQCTKPQDVETHQTYEYDNLDVNALKAKVKNTLDMTLARANATIAPATGTYTVILSEKHVKEILSYYLNRSSASMVYPKYSNYELGCNVQGDEVTGELLNITLKAKVPYSEEGIPMMDRPLLTDGKLQTIHGNSRFSYYLGMEPTGNYDSFYVPSGTKEFQEMKADKYLHVINFSDFQMDTFSGYFAGEIRLAFLSDGNTIIPVTGGSINGNLLEAQKNITFSKEMQIDMNYEGPYAICLENVSVAGA